MALFAVINHDGEGRLSPTTRGWQARSEDLARRPHRQRARSHGLRIDGADLRLRRSMGGQESGLHRGAGNPQASRRHRRIRLTSRTWSSVPLVSATPVRPRLPPVPGPARSGEPPGGSRARERRATRRVRTPKLRSPESPTPGRLLRLHAAALGGARPTGSCSSRTGSREGSFARSAPESRGAGPGVVGFGSHSPRCARRRRLPFACRRLTCCRSRSSGSCAAGTRRRPPESTCKRLR